MSPRGRAALLTVALRREPDFVLARQRARQIAAHLQLAPADQTRFATAVSEIARNAWMYGGGGEVELAVEPGPPAALVAHVRDRGPGIRDLGAVLSGRYVSRTGMGVGMSGSRRLVDDFDVRTGPEGTDVLLAKHLPGEMPTPRELGALAAELARARAADPVEELSAQNQELARALDELRARERELVAVNRELEDTNRGVVALYAELDEKADYLRRASELKSRFLSNMSHEFRTPLNTVISFCRLLLDETDGPLNDEQQRQVGFARQAAEGMLELVNDLLDLARVEAGKTVVRPAPFEVAELFGALRGMLRPLLATTQVGLVFEEPRGLPALHTDEAKVSQVLRNFLSNAIKFTEKGEVRVSARAEGDEVVLSVADTGIGIAPEHHGRIFEEWAQVETPLHGRSRGSGLGLPLSKKLAELLGGRISVESALGQGSTFSLAIPARYSGPLEISAAPDVVRAHDPARLPVLVVEDNPETVLVYEKFLKGTPYQALPAPSIAEARRALARVTPVAIVLDVMLGNETAWPLLQDLKSSARTRGIPIFVVTLVENRAKARALGADDFAEKPVQRAWLLERLGEAARGVTRPEVLVVDDDDGARYLLRALLAETRFAVAEARDGEEALARVRAVRPAAIFLDLEMPGLRGDDVLARLKEDPATAAVPVIVYTGAEIGPDRRAALARADAILPKSEVSRGALLERVRGLLARLVPAPTPPPPAPAEAPP